jgi:hypothetical protein
MEKETPTTTTQAETQNSEIIPTETGLDTQESNQESKVFNREVYAKESFWEDRFKE